MMKAAVYDGKRLQIKDVPEPETEENQALIKIKAVGVCGTDLAIVKGHLPTPTPIIPGHEIIGLVSKVGKNVDSRWMGKRVAIEINANIDHSCFYCQREKFTQCVNRKALGIDIDGGFAEKIAVDDYLLHEIPDSISDIDATFIEPLAAAYQTFEMMPLKEDDNNAVIFGLGKLGLLICQVAILKGLQVIVVDGSPKKLELARKYGAAECINRLEIENIPEKIKSITNGLGADIVIDTSGNPDALGNVIASCRTLGKLHIKSTHGLSTPLNITDMVVRELTLYTSRCGPFDKAIEGLSSGQVLVKDLVSEMYPLEKIEEAIDAYEKSRDFIKSIITF